MSLIILAAVVFGTWAWSKARGHSPSDHEKNGWWKDGS